MTRIVPAIVLSLATAGTAVAGTGAMPPKAEAEVQPQGRLVISISGRDSDPNGARDVDSRIARN